MLKFDTYDKEKPIENFDKNRFNKILRKNKATVLIYGVSSTEENNKATIKLDIFCNDMEKNGKQEFFGNFNKPIVCNINNVNNGEISKKIKSIMYYFLGLKLYRGEKNEEALNYLLKSTNLSNFIPSYNLIGMIYANTEEYEKAMYFINYTLKNDSSITGAYNSKGIVLGKLGDYQQSLDCFKQVVKMDSGYASGFNNLSATYLKIGDYNNALKSIERAIELEPKMGLYYFTKGKVFLKA